MKTTNRKIPVITIAVLARVSESELRHLTSRIAALQRLQPTTLEGHWMIKGEWLTAPRDVSKPVADYYERLRSAQLMWSFGKTGRF